MPSTDDQLLEIIGHLGAALMQTVPTDDQIIMSHVREAHTDAITLRRLLLTSPKQQRGHEGASHE